MNSAYTISDRVTWPHNINNNVCNTIVTNETELLQREVTLVGKH